MNATNQVTGSTQPQTNGVAEAQQVVQEVAQNSATEYTDTDVQPTGTDELGPEVVERTGPVNRTNLRGAPY